MIYDACALCIKACRLGKEAVKHSSATQRPARTKSGCHIDGNRVTSSQNHEDRCFRSTYLPQDLWCMGRGMSNSRISTCARAIFIPRLFQLLFRGRQSFTVPVSVDDLILKSGVPE